MPRTQTHQPPTELVFGAPVIVRHDDGETIVEVQTQSGLRELKRFSDT
ncbi:hypothetical protein [Natronoglomus mannanivorans]|uniref:Uncharacterized protein n=1 Tax=Natronoglomus mannanivorans TaxID=2979990 RepID=A0AAP3E3J2_9EURY|nr:hypothetical protein [Halobacteria archaeon AArc-xg1-1]